MTTGIQKSWPYINPSKVKVSVNSSSQSSFFFRNSDNDLINKTYSKGFNSSLRRDKNQFFLSNAYINKKICTSKCLSYEK